MVPKRSLKEKKVSTFRDFDRSKSLSFDAKVRFVKVVDANKSFILERCMKFNDGLEGIADVIEILGQRNFFKELNAAIESLVQELQATFSNVVDDMVFRNVVVHCRPNDINGHYYFLHIGEGKYEQYLCNVDYNTIQKP